MDLKHHKHFERLFFLEKTFVDDRDETPAAIKLKRSRLEIAAAVENIGKSGDLDLIIRVERGFLENDQAQYSNSPGMKGSLQIALVELSQAERHIAIVDDPARYRAVDEDHGLPKNRKGPLPYDEARQFFNSHATRLINMDKVRLDAEEKKIADARKHNMRVADKLYIDRQRKTLGIEAAPTKKRGQALSR